MSRPERVVRTVLVAGYVLLCLQSWILALAATTLPAFLFCGLFLVVGVVMLYRLATPAGARRRALGSSGALW